MEKCAFPNTPMSNVLYTCVNPACRKDVVLDPPLIRRLDHEGLPMTRKHALFLFRDSKAGMCTDCYIEHRNEQADRLMHRISQERADARAAATIGTMTNDEYRRWAGLPA